MLAISRNRGRLVSKAELIDHICGHVAVTENSLVQCIKDIRQVLNGNSQFEIKTVPKRGYVFEGRLTEATDRASEANAGQFPALPDRPSIAVLPFENLSEEPDQEHFADGVTEDLITGLSRIKWLFVIARNSTFIYRDRGRVQRYRPRAWHAYLCAEAFVAQQAIAHQCSVDRSAGTGCITGPSNTTANWVTSSPVQNEIARNVVGAIEPFVLPLESTRASLPARRRISGVGAGGAGANPCLASQQ